jgi:hypothetical protein
MVLITLIVVGGVRLEIIFVGREKSAADLKLTGKFKTPLSPGFSGIDGSVVA